MLKKLFLFAICFYIFPIMLQGWDPASHIILSGNMKEIWQDFDPDFYDALTAPDYDKMPTQEIYENFMTKKFYYIGTTLPDMFDLSTQEAIRSLINKAWDKKDDLSHWVSDINFGLYIEDVTHDNVQTFIDFNDEPPNQNLEKIREMVEYAKNQGWTPYEKALIYGCYAHLLEDVVAHLILQPATFGYGRSIESPELLYDEDDNEIGLLFAGELYSELFTPTHIDWWDFSGIFIFSGVFDDGPWFIRKRAYLEFYYYYNPTNRPIPSHTWQQTNDFPAIEKFIEAANAASYDVDNLTYERMRSYMHGWAITLFFYMGFRLSQTSETGGIIGHPGWTPLEINNFILGILDDAVSSSFFLHILDIFGGFWDSIIDFGIYAGIYGSWFIEGAIPEYVDLHPPYYQWPYYLESTEGWNLLWAEEAEKPDIVNKIGSAIQYYQDHSTVKKPNLRDTYSDQVVEGLNFAGFIRDMIDGEYSVWYRIDDDFDGDTSDMWSVARKAGLLGGMYDVDNSREYYLQPGIFDIHFESGGNPIYYIENELPSTVELKYKIITFRNTKISINGKKEDGSWDRLVEEEITQAYTYINSSLSLNVLDAVNNGYIELFFEVRTKAKDGSSNYQTMLLSDYEDAFNSTTNISDNQLYKHYFTEHGIPRRAPGQDPIANPNAYWPYAISLVPNDIVLQNITVGTGQTKTYLAANSIQAAGDNTDFIILNGGEVALEAGNYIHLRPGFEARTGCTFASTINSSLIGTYSTSTIASLTRNATFSNTPESKKDSAKIPVETASEETKEPIPTVFSCAQNSPNPFNINTTIKYGLPKNSNVSLCIYNLAGQKVRILVDAQESAGYKSVSWDGRTGSGAQVPQGIYLYKLQAGNEFEKTYKMIVVR